MVLENSRGLPAHVAEKGGICFRSHVPRLGSFLMAYDTSLLFANSNKPAACATQSCCPTPDAQTSELSALCALSTVGQVQTSIAHLCANLALETVNEHEQHR